MAVLNERNAGRKPSISREQLEEIRIRHEKGETITKLSSEYGVSRQTLSAGLNDLKRDDAMDKVYHTYKKWAALNREFHKKCNVSEYLLRMEYMCENELCSVILVNFAKKEIKVINRTDEVIHQAFGAKAKPDWADFEYFLESRCFPRGRDRMKCILRDLGLESYDPLTIIEKTKGRMAEDKQWLRLSYYQESHSCT